ncbi:hypothetical protein [Curtobacterium sp. Leaf261]|uniref:hypothetical protein n=1 Tax=Curtobacterium sp. Leaf261 TaxID=1736311 RepID=UPI0006F3F26F|nr:hypothetical protein [Curtobacterium sp. Leaf261]KQO63473.1 hypothetical protein ASF23_04260 [Curtobacterium sp. Leaf261]
MCADDGAGIEGENVLQVGRPTGSWHVSGVVAVLVAVLVIAVTVVAGHAPTSASAATSAAAPSSGRFTAVDTARVFTGTVGTTIVRVPISGRGGIPSNATAVVVNVETENPTADGYVRVTPAGRDASVATQEFVAGTTISNLATVRLVGGAVQVKLSAGSATVFMDVSGYYADDASASTYTPLANSRVFSGTVGTTPTKIPVAGLGGVPSDATAVVVNAEVSVPTATGYVRVTPFGKDATVATQEFTAGKTVSNLVIAKLAGGAVQAKLSRGQATLFMDVAGYYSTATTGSVFVPLDTARAFAGSVTTTPQQIQLAGPVGVPGNATAVVATVEVSKPAGAGYVRVTPYGQDPTVATQVFSAGQTISNLVIAKVSQASVQVKLSSGGGSAGLFIDVAGYFTDGAATSGLGNDVSYPQCGAQLPVGQEFGVVGVNDGIANKINPCLAQQLAWARSSGGGTSQPAAALYVLAANAGQQAAVWPTSNVDPSGTTVMSVYGNCAPGANAYGTACSYMYGWTLAYNDLANSGVTAPSSYRWWLDVETGATWRDGATNVAVLDGMTDFFATKGVSVGLYSTNLQWGQIAAGVTPRSALRTAPNWVANGPTTLAAAKAACAGTPLLPGGRITMSQYVVGTVASGQDWNVACG